MIIEYLAEILKQIAPLDSARETFIKSIREVDFLRKKLTKIKHAILTLYVADFMLLRIKIKLYFSRKLYVYIMPYRSNIFY